MKYFLVIFIFLTRLCTAQQWQAEAMAGISGYNGDLSSSNISFKTIGPAFTINLKHLLPSKYLLLRAGISYGQVAGNDKNSSRIENFNRNLSFKTNIADAMLGVELNLLNPEYYTAYPYIFAGAGVFHFNPYTHDQNNQKVYLQPLGTEGQGLPQYPDRKMYSRTQFCIPFGGGWIWTINEKYSIIYELGGRVLFTDYLDDVSTTYANPQLLLLGRGQQAVDLANRSNSANSSIEGKRRGNTKVKDWYYMSGLKLAIKFGKKKYGI